MTNALRINSFLLWGSKLLLASTLVSCGVHRKAPIAKSDAYHPKIEHEFLETENSSEVEIAEEEASESLIVDEKNVALSLFIEDWKGTPHVMGGNSKKGVDCSGFVIQCYANVYEKQFKYRRAEDLYSESKPVKKKDLKEGDLVFFKIRGKRIDHVGIYIGDDRFAHTSASRGVMISSLNEVYFSKRFFAAGRPNL